MRRESSGNGGFIKYVVSALILAFIVALMLYTSGSNRPFDEIKQSVENALDKSNLKERDTASFKRDMGLNAADYAGVMYYASESNVSTEEVLLIKVKNDDQIQEVTAAIEERIEGRINDFDGYAPEEVKLLEDAKMSVRGRYIFLAVAPKADEYLAAFSRSL